MNLLTRQSSVVVVAAAAISLTSWVQGQGIDYAKIDILTEKIAPSLYMLAGSDWGRSSPASRRDLRYGRSSEASIERRNRRLDSGPGGPHRRRHDDPF